MSYRLTARPVQRPAIFPTISASAIKDTISMGLFALNATHAAKPASQPQRSVLYAILYTAPPSTVLPVFAPATNTRTLQA